MADIIQLNQEEIKSQLGDMVRKSVEDTLNAMLEDRQEHTDKNNDCNDL